MSLCVAVFAPCGLLLPLFFPLSLIPGFFWVCRAFTVRHGYPPPVYSLFFIFLFHFLIYFISHLRPPVVVAFGHPLPFMFFFLFPGAFGPFSV